MKKNIHLAGLALTLLIVSCASDSTSDLIDIDEDGSDGLVTFVSDVQPVISNTCFPCHDNPPSNGAPQSLTTFQEVLNSVENENLVGRVNSVSSPMPPSGLLPVELRSVFQAWVDDGLLEGSPE